MDGNLVASVGGLSRSRTSGSACLALPVVAWQVTGVGLASQRPHWDLLWAGGEPNGEPAE